MERELTRLEIQRQDFVDGRIFELMQEFAPEGADLQWDIESIANVREAIRYELVIRRKLMTEMDFYPYIDTSDDA